MNLTPELEAKQKAQLAQLKALEDLALNWDAAERSPSVKLKVFWMIFDWVMSREIDPRELIVYLNTSMKVVEKIVEERLKSLN